MGVGSFGDNGELWFDIYSGRVLIDETELSVPVHAGDDIADTLIMQLVVNKPKGILTLLMVEGD